MNRDHVTGGGVALGIVFVLWLLLGRRIPELGVQLVPHTRGAGEAGAHG